ncbi:TetR/AcrR family transcriptional regulator [Streptomyces sp. NPDC059900]|uniref:TetR/AcrR family transcriptional regulator n=1 Tax=Streptomyces sp. NPDC059900 TaxID=3155816 RepID=UPI0034363D0D
MTKQQRAARTRQALIEAAAGEFDRVGYQGSSLARISEAAGVTLGALTFHFPAKQRLCAAVRLEGYERTCRAVEHLTGQAPPGILSGVRLTRALVTLLEEEAVVRASARISRELPGAGPCWESAWRGALHRMIEAGAAQELRPEVCAAAVSALAGHLVNGAEAQLRAEAGAGRGFAGVRLTQMWELVLYGVLGAGVVVGMRPPPGADEGPLLFGAPVAPVVQTALQPPSTGTAPPVMNDA